MKPNRKHENGYYAHQMAGYYPRRYSERHHHWTWADRINRWKPIIPPI